MDINDEIVISGVSGRFPECNNLEELKDALLRGDDLVTDGARYDLDFKGVPTRTGKLPELDKFDESFFEMHPKWVDYTDPRHRILLETVFEAIVDAGYNPSELRGSKTGVFVGMSMAIITEENTSIKDSEGFSFLGNSPFHAANRISYCFDFKGPSYSIDNACCTSLCAFTNAYYLLKTGEIDNAIVGGSHINLNPNDAEHFSFLQLLSSDACKVFSTNRDGFIMSEAIISCLLQRKSVCRRSYATVLGAKTNIDGYKKEGMIHPSSDAQSQLIKQVFDEAGVNIDNVEYVELHGTGTPVGDLVECQTLVNIFGKRTKPLLVGSIKSRLGHTETASGLVGIAKALITMETGIISANLHMDPVDTSLPGIGDGKLQYVSYHIKYPMSDEKAKLFLVVENISNKSVTGTNYSDPIVKSNTEYKGGIIGVNSFGVGGANVHVLLRQNETAKIKTVDKLRHRLVQVSGRTQEAVEFLLDEVEKSGDDKEFLSLVDQIHKTNVEGHCYRGYIVLGENSTREISKYKSEKRPIWFIFSGMGTQWPGMGKDLMQIETFRKTFIRCAEAMKSYGVDLEEAVMSSSAAPLENIDICFSAIAAIIVALTDLLTSLGIIPDHIAGHSLGEIGCAYANGDITAEQAVLLAYSRGYACKQTTLPRGQMAGIGLSKEKLKKILPEDVFIACQNGKDNVTISGPEQSVKTFVEELDKKGVFTKLVNTANIAFHSKYLMDADKYMLEFGKKVLTNPQPRSKKWISTSVSVEQRNEEWSNYNCPEYHVNNYKNTVLFDEIYEHIQKNAILIEIAPHGLLTSILKREIGPGNTLISLMNRRTDDQERFLLSSIGQIFTAGGQPNLRNFYKETTFPVSRGTKMIAPLVKWDHTTSWRVPYWKNQDCFGRIITVNLTNEKYSFLQGHNVDGRVLMPGTGYLVLVWEVMAEMNSKNMKELPIVIEQVKFLRSTVLSDQENAEFLVNIMKSTGSFEIYESGSLVVSGKISTPKDVTKHYVTNEIVSRDSYSLVMKKEDFYKEVRLRMFIYSGTFQVIAETDVNGLVAKLEWNNFTNFLDGMLQLPIIGYKTRDLIVPSAIKRLVVDPKVLLEDPEQKYYEVKQDKYLQVIKSKGIEVFGAKFATAPKRQKVQTDPLLETYEFVEYISTLNHKYDLDTSLNISVQIILQNLVGYQKVLTILEVRNKDYTLPNKIKEIVENVIKKQIMTDAEYLTLELKETAKEVGLIVIDTVIAKTNSIDDLTSNLNPNGFILYIGNWTTELSKLDIIFQTPSLLLLRLQRPFPILYDTINIRNSDFNWLDKLKTLLERTDKETVYLFSENEEASGIMGLMKCLLTEDIKVDVKSVWIDGKAIPFSADDCYYRKQLSKRLTFNILRGDKWGTYVHFPLKEVEKKVVTGAEVSLQTVGNLASLCWIEKPLFKLQNDDSEIVNVKYLALNFKDVLVATGMLHMTKGIGPKDNTVELGFEYAGYTQSGRRVMGMLVVESFNTQVRVDPELMWEVPESWSLEEAATVSVVYSTCYYGMILRGHMEKGESILIHAGTGGVGMAAISIALSLNATVFTTVSSQEKKELLLKTYPQLEESYIGYSRDSSFYNMIKIKTKGKGVNVILNSLSGELFTTSLDCLASEGRFLEIGKVDFVKGTPIESGLFLDNCSVHGIILDVILAENKDIKRRLNKLLSEGIASGVVKPLPATVFNETELESAWRFLASGKHKGKVLIKLQDETSLQPSTVLANPKISFDPEKVYIIIGGLGGMGLELANWLFTKGARKVILNSRRPIWNGYQSYCMEKWSSFQNVIVKVNLDDTTTVNGTEKLIKEAQELGPVEGIFHTALVLKDATISNQTASNFRNVFEPKVNSTKNLDVVTRIHCSHLKYFVVCSSIVTGRGNIGQTNYGMANATLEKICENRRWDRLPGLAVQWGPIGDVGVLSGEYIKHKNIMGLIPQKITSCLNALETFIIQKATVGASFVLPEHSNSIQSVTKKTPANTVANILRIENIDSIDTAKNLYQFGLDSLMTSEIKQTLYRNFQLEIELKDVKELTFGYLIDLEEETNDTKFRVYRKQSVFTLDTVMEFASKNKS